MCRYIIIQRPLIDEPSIVGEYDAEGAARAAAEEMADCNHGARFEVFQLLGHAVMEPRVSWKGVKA